MFGRIFDSMTGRKTLLDDARGDAMMMLNSDRRMFELVMLALKDEAGQQIRNRIMSMDKDINRQQQVVRKKVFEHLTLSKGHDLRHGLELTIAVIDLERIGDYNKNISEIVEMMPRSIDFGEFEEVYGEIVGLAHDMFDDCITAFSKQDSAAANAVMEKYQRVSNLCDGTLERVMTNTGDSDVMERQLVALMLLLRYLKRVGAHLKNIASAIVNPYHRIGFRG